MEGVGWLGAIIVGGIAGWIAERVTQSNMGILANILLGIVGARGAERDPAVGQRSAALWLDRPARRRRDRRNPADLGLARHSGQPAHLGQKRIRALHLAGTAGCFCVPAPYV